MDSDSSFQPYLILGESLRWSVSVRSTAFQQIRPFLPVLGIFVFAFLLIFIPEVSHTQKAEVMPVVAQSAGPLDPDKTDKKEPTSSTESIVVDASIALFFSSFITLWLSMMYFVGFKELFANRFYFSQSSYGLTEHRLIWINGDKQRRVYSYLLVNMEHFRLDEGPNGTGDIYVTVKPHGPHHPFQPPLYKPSQPVLRGIPDAAQLYRLLFQAKVEANN